MGNIVIVDIQPGEGYLVKMFADDVLIYPSSSSFTCGDPFTGHSDGQIYNTVQIGDQRWMAENLNIDAMINGSYFFFLLIITDWKFYLIFDTN